MSNIKIISSGRYIPNIKITNEELEKKYQVEEKLHFKKNRYKAKILCKGSNRRVSNKSFRRSTKKYTR